VITLTFFLMRAVPGGPFSAERALPAAVEQSVSARYHLDWPLWKQYFHALGPLNLDEHGVFGDGTHRFGGILAGDLGPSFKHRDLSVNDVIAQSLPISVALGLCALAWAVVVGVAAGVVAAFRPGGWIDHLVRATATLGLSLPNFVVASLLILAFAFALPVLPVAGWGSLEHLVLPGAALGLPFAASIARLLRASLLDTLSQDYIRTAVAKGASRWRVVRVHALKGALLPVISFLGPASAGILTGSLVIERIFAIPGTGSHFVASALNRDYTLAMGVTLLYTVLVFGLNTLVDVVYTLLDPRIDVGTRA
jgi:oligopeptide transport system permease protein